jgi:myo-inositol-1(or 4)-monophosphatase
VTTADLAADRILHEQLLAAFPGDGWLSEETLDDPARLGWPRVWVVDPLDGTREFVKGIPEFAISVALVVAGRVVLGLVHNPISGELFHALRGGGAHLDGQAHLFNQPRPQASSPATACCTRTLWLFWNADKR